MTTSMTSSTSATSSPTLTSTSFDTEIRRQPPSDLTPPTLTPTVSLSPVSIITPDPPKRPRSPARALALTALVEDLVDHNTSTSRSSPLLASPLPSLSTILLASRQCPQSLSDATVSDASLVCAAYYLAALDARLPVTSANASALLVACLGAGAVDAERDAAPAAIDSIAASAGIGSGEVWEYAQIVRIYVPRMPGLGEYRVYDELLQGMVEGLVDW